jgi:hypothetical protein
VELAAAITDRQVNRVRRKRCDKVGEKPSGDGDGALFLNLSADPAGRSDHEVGGDELEAPFVCGEEYVRGLRKGTTGGDGTPDDAEAPG